MDIFTGAGDNKMTSLYSGEEVSKADQRINTLGSLDELNSFIGLGIAHIHKLPSPPESSLSLLAQIQIKLLELGSLVGDPNADEGKFLSKDIVKQMELEISRITKELPILLNFVVPGGALSACYMHICRTVCRRAERDLVLLEGIHHDPLIFINRLSDFFFILARYSNYAAGGNDVLWDGK